MEDLHYCHLSFPLRVSVQGKFISGHSRIRKGYRDLGQSIIQTQSVFGGLVIRREVLSESSHRIETHLDVVKEIIEIQSSVSFELCLDEELIEFW